MRRLYQIRLFSAFVTALALLAFTLALGPAGTARAATASVTYTLATATETPAPCDTPPCQVLIYTFSGTGTATSAAAPASGNFTWTFNGSKHSPSNSCAFTQGTGVLDVTWADTTTEVTFSFKARDAHSWIIKGQVTSGTNTFFPPSPLTPVSGMVGFPPNPCAGATVPATISFFPPQPV